MKKYEILLFDLDGTLIDSQEGITKCAQYALEDQGIVVKDRRELFFFIGPPLDESFSRYGLSDRKIWRAVNKFRERFEKVGLFENQVYPEISPMLADLQRAGKTLAVATSKPWIYTRRILERYDLQKYFQAVVGSEMDGTRVKKTEVIQETIRCLGNPARENILMIGDRKQDMEGAQACRIAAAGAGYGYGESGELAACQPVFIADTVAKLADFLENR